MAEFEVETSLEGETDVDIDFKEYFDKKIAGWDIEEEKLKMIEAIIKEEKYTFISIEVALEGTDMVEIEPADYH